MGDTVKKEYSQFHINKSTVHLYPTEWVIRTWLGTYPQLKLDRSKYAGSKVLDLGFGDGRNIPLLLNCGLNVCGVEITEEICLLAKQKLSQFTDSLDLRVGGNSSIPFESETFDYLLASSSCYYIDGQNTFGDNLKEIVRVLKKGGWFVANFPLFVGDRVSLPESFILQESKPTDDGHVIIQNDIYGIRNGYKFKAFYSSDDLKECLEPYFDEIAFGQTYDNYFGVQINTIFTACRKR